MEKALEGARKRLESLFLFLPPISEDDKKRKVQKVFLAREAARAAAGGGAGWTERSEGNLRNRQSCKKTAERGLGGQRRPPSCGAAGKAGTNTLEPAKIF